MDVFELIGLLVRVTFESLPLPWYPGLGMASLVESEGVGRRVYGWVESWLYATGFLS